MTDPTPFTIIINQLIVLFASLCQAYKISAVFSLIEIICFCRHKVYHTLTTASMNVLPTSIFGGDPQAIRLYPDTIDTLIYFA